MMKSINKRFFFKTQLLRCLILLLLTVQLFVHPVIAQEETNKGIKWTDGLSWEQIKEKAKKENKYIFLDCFATWCGPCKMMDKDVYSNDTTGQYYNDKFINVKVQMDSSGNDNSFIQSWYNDAKVIAKEYRISSYPSYVFLSPQGVITHKASGYRSVANFIDVGKTATVPGKTYTDPYAEFFELVDKYKEGKKDFAKMPYMINCAVKLRDNEFAKQLLNEHTDYVAALPPEQRYTKENLELWAGFLLHSDGKRFSFFYRDGDFIDKVMNKKGFAAAVIDNTIQAEVADTFFTTQPHGNVMKGTPFMILGKKDEPDYTEADWKKLKKMIRAKFDKRFVNDAVLSARLRWYERHHNTYSYAKYATIKLEKASKNGVLDKDFAGGYNWFAWRSGFLVITDKDKLNLLVKGMAIVVKDFPKSTAWIDTYANLLHKVGRTQEAIEWETRVWEMIADGVYKKQVEEVINQMKRGEPTYVNEGAIW